MASETFTNARMGDKAATSDFLRQMTAGMSHQERLDQTRWLAHMMDDQFSIPGTNFRFGWDSIIGLFPGIGDAVTSAVSLLIVHHAWQSGAGPLTLARMLGNVGVDLIFGAVPLVGDVFDAAWKGNRRNMRLLERHLAKQADKQRR
jgi:hypothetical protein